MAVQVKICGLKSIETAISALESGADFIGLNFSPVSKRKIDLKDAVGIMNAIKSRNSKSMKIVGLFFQNPKEEIEKTIAEIPFDYVQYVVHDTLFPLSFLENSEINFIPQISVKENLDDDSLQNYKTEFLILDSYKEGLGGGSGEVFEWENVKAIKRNYFLAGGLNSSNVQKAILKLHPFGVDVASGVESSPGVKDTKLIKEFIKNAKRI